jgi:putative component of membrane protein insertase Oxa1/YidC/SpoIIIJ protein YidD
MKNSCLLIFFLLFSSLSFAQTERERWNKTEDPYLVKVNSSVPESGSSIIVKSFVSLYRLLISDQDGDNCPFHPSCSYFFVESVSMTNIFQGSLMFADRFTRDMNFIGRNERYPLVINNRHYDPPIWYTMENITYPPPVR